MPFDRIDKATREYAVNEYLAGNRTQQSICKELNIGQSTLSRWIKNYYKKSQEVSENKVGFVQELSETLQEYSKRKLKYIEYDVDDNGTETVTVCFWNEPDKKVNVTGEPCIGIMGIIAHILR